MNKPAIITILLITAFLLYASPQQAQPVSKKDLKKLASMMAGTYSSEKQSKEDTSFFHIKLRMKPIWKERRDGYWFYVEQSLATKQSKPYRQRVYYLFLQGDTTIVSKVFEIKNPLKYTGGWIEKGKLDGLTADSLIDRQGCSILLHPGKDGIFAGSTPGKECLSSLRGASYATSEVTVSPGRLVSWDRGWDKDDHQVWGAEKGGYIFIKEGTLK